MTEHRVLWARHPSRPECRALGQQHIVGRCKCGELLEAETADDIAEAVLKHRLDAVWGRWEKVDA